MKDLVELKNWLEKLDKEKTDIFNTISAQAAEIDEERVKLQGEHRLIEKLLGKINEPEKKSPAAKS